MYDQTATYRSTQVSSSTPVAQIVLLYEGAIRFAARHLAALERSNVEAAHEASIRSQAIVSALREVLDMNAGPVAAQLDSLYDFILARLVEGNMTKQPRPTEEAVTVLRDLLDAWRQIAAPTVIAATTTVPDLAAATAAAATTRTVPNAAGTLPVGYAAPVG